MKSKHRVITGIYEGHEFYGYELNGRVVDDNTGGRSYPVENCVDMEKHLRIYCIYKNPSDYPNKFVVRCFWNDKPEQKPFAVVDKLEDARFQLPKGLYCINRHKFDDPVIVETWL